MEYTLVASYLATEISILDASQIWVIFQKGILQLGILTCNYFLLCPWLILIKATVLTWCLTDLWILSKFLQCELDL